MKYIQIKNLTIDFYSSRYDSFLDLIRKFYKTNKNKQIKKAPVLNNINLTIHEGEIVGIIGRNGIGKSTLLKAIAGIYPPTKGEITISGSLNALIELGIGFDEHQTGVENIYLISSILGYSKETIDSSLESIINFSELGDKINMPLKNYSSGMRSRLFFSIATEHAPDILILDEVFATGDSKFIKKATKRIKGIISSSKIVLMVSHNKQRILELCNRCIVLNNGNIVFDGECEGAFDVYEQL